MFRGDLGTRMLSWGEEILRCHVQTEEVPRGVARARRPAGLESERPIAHVAADPGIHPETLRKRGRQAEADAGLRPDLPTSEEREEIRRLRQENFELRRANEILKSASVFLPRNSTQTDRSEPLRRRSRCRLWLFRDNQGRYPPGKTESARAQAGAPMRERVGRRLKRDPLGSVEQLQLETRVMCSPGLEVEVELAAPLALGRSVPGRSPRARHR